MLYVLVGLLFVWGGLLYRSAISAVSGFTTQARATADGCEYLDIVNLPPRDVVIVPAAEVAVMVHPGGWHWRVECPDGSTFYVRVARP